MVQGGTSALIRCATARKAGKQERSKHIPPVLMRNPSPEETVRCVARWALLRSRIEQPPTVQSPMLLVSEKSYMSEYL